MSSPSAALDASAIDVSAILVLSEAHVASGARLGLLLTKHLPTTPHARDLACEKDLGHHR